MGFFIKAWGVMITDYSKLFLGVGLWTHPGLVLCRVDISE